MSEYVGPRKGGTRCCTQSCPTLATLWTVVSSVHEIFQARTLEWLAICVQMLQLTGLQIISASCTVHTLCPEIPWGNRPRNRGKSFLTPTSPLLDFYQHFHWREVTWLTCLTTCILMV